MSDVGLIAESFNGLEEKWSAAARLAALQARRSHSHGSFTAGLGSSIDRVSGSTSNFSADYAHARFVDRIERARPKTGHAEVRHPSGATVRVFAAGAQEVHDTKGRAFGHPSVDSAAKAASRNDARFGLPRTARRTRAVGAVKRYGAAWAKAERGDFS